MNPDVQNLERLRLQRISESEGLLPECDGFPLESLPLCLRRFVKEASISLCVPTDMVAVPVIVALGSAIGASRLIAVKQDWLERAGIYAAIVAEPGSMKSSALNLIMEPIRRKQEQLIDELRKKQKDAADVNNSATRTWVSDTTVEKLGCLLFANLRGLILCRDELSAWVRSMNQYKMGKGADRQFYLSCWSGKPVLVDRQGRETVYLRRPFLSVLGCIPPDMLSDLSSLDEREDGFSHRILFCVPSPVPVRWSDQTVSPEARSGYHDLMQALYDLNPKAGDGEDGVILPLSQEATEAFKGYFDAINCEAEADDFVPALRGFYAKFRGYLARLALIHAIGTDPYCKHVPVYSVEAAARQIGYFKVQARKAISFLCPAGVTRDGRCEMSIKRALKGRNWVWTRDLQRSVNQPAVVFHRVHSALIKNGVVVQKSFSKLDKRGRAREIPASKLVEDDDQD